MLYNSRIYDTKFITELKPEARKPCLACHSTNYENGAHRIGKTRFGGLHPKRGHKKSSVNISHNIIKDPAGLFVDTLPSPITGAFCACKAIAKKPEFS
jgi:hypothetical protein